LSLLDGKGVRVLRGPGVFADGKYTPTGDSRPDGSRAAAVASLEPGETKTADEYVCQFSPESCGPDTELASNLEGTSGAKPASKGFSLTRGKRSNSESPGTVPTSRASNSKPRASRAVQKTSYSLPITPGDWLVELGQGEVICLPDDGRPALLINPLLRGANSTITITDTVSKQSRSVEVSRTQSPLSWPLPNIEFGRVYVITSGGGSPVTVTVKSLVPSNDSARGDQRISPDCDRQIELNARMREEIADLRVWQVR
jgi:hypothetical protein